MTQHGMPSEIYQVGPESLPQYAKIPITVQINTIFRVDLIDSGLGGFALREEKVAQPYTKDYDAIEGEGSIRPSQWPDRFDIRDWGFFLAYNGMAQTDCVGGAAVALNSSEWDTRGDVSVLADIRVHPDYRHLGIGTKLFRHTADWSRAKGCRQMKVETQNVNVAACRFYAKMGCQLGTIDRYAYADTEVENEVMLVWYLDL